MILLGKCPNCGAEDTLFVPEAIAGVENWKVVRCNGCNAEWPDWLKLLEAERGNGKRLIAVDVQETRSGTHIPFPLKEEIPFVLTIAQVANAALMLRFKLTTCFACEGGVEGRVSGGYVELRNDHNRLGLTDDCWLVPEERTAQERAASMVRRLPPNALHVPAPRVRQGFRPRRDPEDLSAGAGRRKRREDPPLARTLQENEAPEVRGRGLRPPFGAGNELLGTPSPPRAYG